MDPDTEEITYYRAIEDFFAAARGVPHILSPKDVQLMVGWWRENIPLEAVTSGIAEVFARKRAQGNDDPTVSLSYCRHAVKTQARRYAELRAGTSESCAPTTGSATEAIATLRSRLQSVARDLESTMPRVAEVILTIDAQFVPLDGIDSAVLDDVLFNLESALYEGCWRNLPDDERRAIEEAANAGADRSGAVGEAWDRAVRALCDRELRTRLGLPRLAIDV